MLVGRVVAKSRSVLGSGMGAGRRRKGGGERD